MPKTEMKAKRSTRKPLRDVSNGTKKPKFDTKFNNNNNNNNNNKYKSVELKDEKSDQLDRLVLVHSDLSSILNQVDELVAKALKAPNKIQRKEIESFTQVLSEIQSSLKPWPLRFQKALSTHSSDTKNQLNQAVVNENVHASEDTTDVVHSPDESPFESLISPSPLVAWQRECNVDGGRQLFLLTPLPKSKAFSSNLRGSSLHSVFEKFKSDDGFQSLVAVSNNINGELLGDRESKPAHAQMTDIVENKRESAAETEIVSPPKFSQKDCSLLVFTPRMKMSPPKSCVLLEPISEATHKSYHGVRKSTPFPVALQGLSTSESSESSSSGESEDLTLKYPELFGLQPNYKLGNRRKGLESSPDWFMSPPKSCVLMEPSDEKLLTDAMKNCQLSKTACMPDQLKNALPDKRDDGKSTFTAHEFGDKYMVVESTPMIKEPESTFRAGKRPGENTLKKELWTKFEAASTLDDFRFDVSVLKTSQKGFLDRLEEVFVDEAKSNI